MNFGRIQFDLSQIEDPGARAWIDRRRGELQRLFTEALATPADPEIQLDIERAAILTAMVESSSARANSATATYQDGIMAGLANIAAKARTSLHLPAGTYEDDPRLDEAAHYPTDDPKV